MNAIIPARNSVEVVRQLDEAFSFPRPIVDVTWGKGRFWSGQEVIGLDAYSESPAVRAQWEHLPIRLDSVGTLVFDPPHLPYTGKNSAWNNRGYGFMEWTWKGGIDPQPIIALFKQAALVLRNDGFLLVKTADMIHAHRPWWLTPLVMGVAEDYGFALYDWIISFRPAPLIDKRWVNTFHARKHHAHWLLFVPPGGVNPKGKLERG